MNSVNTQQIYLASQSPRRAEILLQMGVSFQQVAINIDETIFADETEEVYVNRLAIEKACAGQKIADNKLIPVLGSDTAVCLHNEILGKPTDQHDTERMLTLLSGNTHKVVTSVALLAKNYQKSIVQTSFVSMRKLTRLEISEYIKTGESQGKAGAYAIQGIAAKFISNINGSYSGIMGLPIFETSNLLQHFFSND